MINKILCILILIITILFGIYYTYGITPFLRKTYKIEAWLTNQGVNCIKSSPQSKKVLKNIIYDFGSLSNQFVILKKSGAILSCITGEEVVQETRFRYASLTKPITAALFLEHERQKEISRNDLIEKYIPIINPIDKKFKNITLENFLTHTSGFDRLRSLDPIIHAGRYSWCPYNLDKINKIYLDHKPNHSFSYDNRNYCLLAVALERATHKTYEQLLSEYLLKYGFNHIFLLKGPFLEDEVKYDFRYEEYYFPSYAEKFDFHAMQAVAGLSGSAIDYAKLIHFFLYERRLPLIENITQYKGTKGEIVNLSIALRQKKMKTGEKVFYHTGALPAARSLLMIRENGDIIVWLGSGVPADPNLETEDLMEVILSNIN